MNILEMAQTMWICCLVKVLRSGSLSAKFDFFLTTFLDVKHRKEVKPFAQQVRESEWIHLNAI